MSDEIARLAKRDEVQVKLRNAGVQPVGSTSEEFAAFLATDHAKWSKVIRAANMSAE